MFDENDHLLMSNMIYYCYYELHVYDFNEAIPIKSRDSLTVYIYGQIQSLFFFFLKEGHSAQRELYQI